jgi:hypothetical protein
LNKNLIYLILTGIGVGQCASASTVFVPTFTTGFNTSFGANAAIAQAAWLSAANMLAANFSDNIHINITVDGVAGTSILGQSSTAVSSVSFLNLYNAILTDATSADDFTVTGTGGSLGGNGTAGSASDPLGTAADHLWFVTKAQQKALGMIVDDFVNDGTITLGAGFSFTFSGAIAPGTIDFQGVVLHEISEIMGRIGLSGQVFGGKPAYTVVDAYSFSGASTRNMGNGANANFSIDYGATLLKAFNDQATNGGDSRDWASGTNDAFNAFSSSGVANGISAVDLRIMDVIGYTLAVQATPEPASVSLLAAGFLGLFFARRRR